jgi:hypothetical protein
VEQVPGKEKVRIAACLLMILWWALVDDLRTLPLGQIVAGIPHIGEFSLL